MLTIVNRKIVNMQIPFSEMLEIHHMLDSAIINGRSIMLDWVPPYEHDGKGVYCESGFGGKKLACSLDTIVDVLFKNYKDELQRLQNEQKKIDRYIESKEKQV